MNRYVTAGIDIGTHATRVVVAETREDSPRHAIKILGIGSADSRGVRHGYIENIEDATRSVYEAIGAAEKKANFKIKRALLSIGGIGLEAETSTSSIIIGRTDNKIGDDDVDRCVMLSEEGLKFRNKKILHRFPLSFKIDGKEIWGRPHGMHGMKLEVKTLFVTCLDQHLEDFITVIEGAGVDVEDVVASPLAASIVTLSKLQRTAGCVLANIGAETVSIAVFEDDKLISLQVSPIGSTDITNDIALGLKIPLEEAEEIKMGKTEHKYSQRRINDIIEARLGDIFDLIQSHLKKLGRNELLPAGIIITGGGGGTPHIEEIARATLHLPARIAILHTLTGPSAQIPLGGVWSVAYGLCIFGFDNSYASDLSQINHVRIRGHLRGLTGWLRQFLP